VLDILLARADGKEGTSPDAVMELFQYAMFYLLVYKCFGNRASDETVRAIVAMQNNLLSNFLSFQVFSFRPTFTKLVFHRR
jgi:cytochrome P450 family 89 subfamily A